MNLAKKWFELKKWKPFLFQTQTWQAIINNHSGLLNSVALDKDKGN